MTIGFDAKRATQNYTGLGNYSRYTIAQVLKHNAMDDNFVLFSPSFKDNSFEEEKHLKLCSPEGFFDKKLKAYWRSFSIKDDILKHKIDLYHGLSHELPFGIKATGVKSVVTIHDLIYLRYPQYFKYIDRKIYDLKFRYSCAQANKIIAISTQTKEDIIQYFGIAESKIEVVFQNCDEIFYTKKNDEALQEIKTRYLLPSQYILSVGTVEPRKNIMAIAKALKFVHQDIKWVIVGRHTAYAEMVKHYLAEHNLTERVLWLQNISFEDLPGIYQLASSLVYTSEFEGFGIPIVEALASGIPVITTANACMPETAGPNSIYIEETKPEAVSEAINNVYNNYELRNNTINEGYAYLQKFDSELNTKKLIDIYHTV